VVGDPDLSDVLRWLRDAPANWKRVGGALEEAAFVVVLLAAATYIGVRLGAPYYFETANPLDPRLGGTFISNLHALSAYDSPDAWYPPGVQWVHKPAVTFALINLAVFGLGVPIFLAVVAGAYVTVARLWRSPMVVILAWTVAVFVYQSVQYVKTMRYFILLYPALALLAGVGLAGLQVSLPRPLKGAVAISLLIWPLAFMSIYTRDLSRVTASEWMYGHLPEGAHILNESWDDPLPIGVPDPTGKTFDGKMMPSFDWDTPSKWKTVNAMLRNGDYLILSSNRGWGSIPTDANQYPRMARFYRDLFAGKTAYREVAQFTSYPSLRYLGIPIDFPDQWSEEAFTVYDHPEVLIFKHVR
jgi:hypothetical protein